MRILVPGRRSLPAGRKDHLESPAVSYALRGQHSVTVRETRNAYLMVSLRRLLTGSIKSQIILKISCGVLKGIERSIAQRAGLECTGQQSLTGPWRSGQSDSGMFAHLVQGRRKLGAFQYLDRAGAGDLAGILSCFMTCGRNRLGGRGLGGTPRFILPTIIS